MIRRLIPAVAALAVAANLSGAALAGANDYAFEPVTAEVKQGEVTLAVRLVHKPTGKAVEDAVITQTRIDMAPDGMAMMASPIGPAPSPSPGTYAFKTDLVMAGRWLLSVSARVQGEAEPVVGKVVFTVKR
jgi:hypothetical protein